VVAISHPTNSLHPEHEVHVYTSAKQLKGEFTVSSSALSANPLVIQYDDDSELMLLESGDSLNTEMIKPGGEEYEDWLETRLRGAKWVKTNQRKPVWMITRKNNPIMFPGQCR
jgi:ribosomal protein L39E